ncbi:MAG: hypothetical protein AAF288_03565 [Planctomycetota bacterium]
MLNFKDAVVVAIEEINDFLQLQKQNNPIDDPDLLVEEIYRPDSSDSAGGGKYWLVTLSFLRNQKTGGAIDLINKINPSRTYKTVKIDAESGEVREITDRLLSNG